MGTLNRIVSVLTLVFAVFSLVFGVMLYSKRDQMVDRGNKMAKIIRDAALAMDKNSETDYAKNLQLTRLPLSPDDKKGITAPQAEDNAKKTLYHDNYNMWSWLKKQKNVSPEGENRGENLQRILAPFLVQSTTIITQRDTLGDTLSKVATSLDSPEPFTKNEFCSVKTYEEKDAKIIDLATKITQRNSTLIEYIVKAGAGIGKAVSPELADKAKKLEDMSDILNKFVDDAQKLKKRSESYAKNIADLLRAMEIRKPGSSEIEGDDYMVALSASITAMKEEKDKLDQTKNDLKKTKDDLQGANDLLATTEKQLKDTTALLEDQKKLVAKLKSMLFNTEGDTGTKTAGNEDEQFRQKEMESKLVGKVLDVNRQYDFVVVNLGKNNIVKKKLPNGKYSEMKVGVPEDKVMYVSRNGQYIAKIKITKVTDDCSMADITSDPRAGDIQVGDNVFFPPPPKRPKSLKEIEGAAAAAAPAGGS